MMIIISFMSLQSTKMMIIISFVSLQSTEMMIILVFYLSDDSVYGCTYLKQILDQPVACV